MSWAKMMGSLASQNLKYTFLGGLANKPEISAVLQLLLDFPLDRKVAAQLAADPWVTIERVTSWISYLHDNAQSFTKGGGTRGMLMSRLRDHIEAPNAPSAQAADTAPMDDEYEPLPEPVHPELSQPLPSGRSPAAIWQSAYGELQLQMPRETFDTWIRQVRLTGYQDGVYTIAVPDTYAQQWLEHRLKKMMLRTLSQVAEQPAEIAFVVWHGDES